MSKKIVVPDGMFQAALEYQDSAVQCSAALEAALLWMDGELEKMCQSNHYEGNLSSHAAMIEVWREGVGDVRRMFLASEPEVPEEVESIVNQLD